MHEVSDISRRLEMGINLGGILRLRANSLTFDVLVVSGVALVLGLIGLGSRSLWVDESFTARWVHYSFLDLADGYHWLYYSIEKPWTFLAGTSEWALRLPSVFGAMLACGLLVMLAQKLFDRWVAIISGLLLATSPFLVKWSQQARGYTLFVAVSLGATLLLLRAFERESRTGWALYGIAFSALIVWHPVGGALLGPGHAVLVFQRRRRVLPHGLLAAAIITALAVPWAGQIALRSTGEGLGMDWLPAPSAETAIRTLLDVSGAAGVGVFLALMGLWRLRRAGRTDLGVWLGVWAFSPFLLALLVSELKPIYLDRYLIAAAPAFALLAGVAVTGVRPRLGAALGLAALIATSIGLVQWYSYRGSNNWRGEDWHAAVNTVLERRAESEALVVVPWWAHPAATYYGARVEDTSTADSIWVLRWSEEGSDLGQAERQPLGFGEHQLVERIPFGQRLSAQLWVRP